MNPFEIRLRATRNILKRYDMDIITEEQACEELDMVQSMTEDDATILSLDVSALDAFKQVVTECWHISRTALAGRDTIPTTYDRRYYIRAVMIEKVPLLLRRLAFSEKELWEEIEKLTAPTL